MRIVSFRHKDLERFWRRDEARGLVRQHESKLRAMLTALEEVENTAELASISGWRLHSLKGDRKGTWTLSITRNYRLTFRVDEGLISDINIEDYH